MIRHEPEVPNIPPSPPLMKEVDPSSTYGTLPEYGPDGTGPLQHVLSQFHDYISSNPQYWLYYPGEYTFHEPTSTRHIRYGMPNIPNLGLVPHVEPVGDLGTVPWGTSIPFHV